MEQSSIKHFACDSIDRALVSVEWKKWIRAVKLYLDSEEITDGIKRRNKVLHLGGPQLQDIAFGLPNLIVDYDTEKKNDVFQTLIDGLDKYFSPQQNSCFERHVFRNMKPEQDENFNKFLIRCRTQANKCSFGKTETEAREINIKDKLIDMWAPIELKRKLLERELPLSEVIEQCQIFEQTRNQTGMMQKNDGSAEQYSVQINRIENSRKRNYQDTVKITECFRCGKRHNIGDMKICSAIKAKCHKCGKIGHFERKCKTEKYRRFNTSNVQVQKPSTSRKINFVNECENQEREIDEMGNFECFEIANGKSQKPTRDDTISVIIGNITIRILIDSGASCNIISGNDWETLIKNKAMLIDVQENILSNIKSYASTKPLEIKCKFVAPVRIEGKKEVIDTFMVVERGSISLLGKHTAITLGVLKLGVTAQINQIGTSKKFPKLNNIRVKLTIDPSVKPVQQPVRRIPIAIESKVENKLMEALESDIIERVEGPSPWISPMVIVFKPDGDIRICIDMRRANKAILRENFPLPTFENFMTKLRGARYFSRLDLSSAYHQLELDEESRPITTFITHMGLFRYKRLMFGINSAPEIFQRIFQSILASEKNCLNYIDDIIVYGKSEEEHDECLQDVLKVLNKQNVLLNEKKCHMKVKELEFLGHTLSSEGIKADPKKVEAVQNFRAPNNKEELRSFLGLVTYLGKFIPNLGDLTQPLRTLIRTETKFIWTDEHEEKFEELKNHLQKLPTLAFFDINRRTRLIADASPVALGAVLLQFNELDQPQVISFASKSLSPIERRYSQTEKESLGLVWAVERFQFYLTAIDFELVTDHKPLEAIFKPTSKPSARIERWLLRLQSFRFKVIYKAGKSNIADPLSRLCKIECEQTFDEPNEFHIRSIIHHTTPKALSISDVINFSKADKEIIEAVSNTANDKWSNKTSSPFYPFRLELTTMGPILLRGNKIVIPSDLRNKILELAHEGHPGETVLKRRLRSKVWWPQIDKDAETHVKRCRECILVSQPNRPPPMTRQKLPVGPWQYLALDYMSGEPNKEHLLVVIDYYSRYMEAVFTKSTNSASVIRTLEGIFCRLGLPKAIKLDNATNFNSEEFKQFCVTNGIEIVNSPPYWPQANGEVENANKSLKKRLQIAFTKYNKDYKKEIMNFMMMYNVTPPGTTGKAPSELLFGRKIRDKIPCLEDIDPERIDDEAYDKDIMNKEKGKQREDMRRKAIPNEIKIGAHVVVKNIVYPHKLTPHFGEVVYEVLNRNGNELTLFGNGKIIKRNVAHMKQLPSGYSVNILNPKSVPSSSKFSDDGTSNTGEPSDKQVIDENLHPSNNQNRVEPLKLIKEGGMWKATLAGTSEPGAGDSGGLSHQHKEDDNIDAAR